MKINVRTKGKVTIFDLPASIASVGGDAVLKREFKAALESGQTFFLLNVTKVPFLDSSMVGEIVACLKRVREKHGDLKVLLKPGGKPDELLRLSALHRVLDLFGDEKKALGSFS